MILQKYNLQIKTVVKPEEEDDSYMVQNEAYSGPGLIINSEYLNGLKVPEESVKNNRDFRKKNR